MFIGALWIYAREGLDAEPIKSAWVLIGFLVAEGGMLPFVASLIAGGIGIRRLNVGGSSALLRGTMFVSIALLAANAVAIWAMAAKPG
jgi:hypothetical protein